MREETKNRYVERLELLIEQGERLSKYVRDDAMGRNLISKIGKTPTTTWQIQVINIIKMVFGEHSTQFKYLESSVSENVTNGNDLASYLGLLKGSYNDFKDGYIDGLESFLARDVYDTVLQEAKYLNNHGYKDPAAVLCRVVLEKTLKRISENYNINQDQKAADLNNLLRTQGAYAKPQWRLVQARLDIGNDAAHGKFDNYSSDDVNKMIEDTERFIAQYLVNE